MSCQKSTHTPDIPYSEGGLISFSTQVETKTPIIRDLYGKHFGVYGYNFSHLTNWGTAKATATPNVFYQLDVTCNTDGACSYNVNTDTDINGLEQWVLNKRYAFFAYYPYGNTTNYMPSDIKVIDDPYIDYNLPISNNSSVNPDNLLDIMTAKSTDYLATQGTIVRFNFYHRLFCIDLEGQNFNTDPVNISNLSMTISGIHYDKVRVYLDRDRMVYDENLKKDIFQPSIPTKSDNWTMTSKVSFPIIGDNGKSLNISEDIVSLSGDKNIVLIPQDSSVEGAVGLTVEIKFKKDGVDITRQSTFKVNFEEGHKYTLTLNFIGDDVILVAAEATTWDSANVNHTFD
jgi:hypothetical protein